jgi:hypothetical protein
MHDEEPIVIDNIESMQHARHVIEIIEKGYIAAQTGKTRTSLPRSNLTSGVNLVRLAKLSIQHEFFSG